MLIEEFSLDADRVVRTVRSGRLSGRSWLPASPNRDRRADLPFVWSRAFLRGEPIATERTSDIRAIDLFCGAGGLTLGASLAADAVGLHVAPALAIDADAAALSVYERNFHESVGYMANVAGLIDQHVDDQGPGARFSYTPDIIDDRLASLIGSVDLVLAGPPCQGHSNLNNHTRRYDRRNELYLRAVGIAIELKTKMFIIENVPDILSDRARIVDSAMAILKESGYFVSAGTLTASAVGGAQRRRRHFLVATRAAHLPILEAANRLTRPQMTLWDAIGDLECIDHPTFMDEAPRISAENRDRIDWLFENDAYDLPNHVRPKSHRDGHTYPSVYGRLAKDQPAPTITTGFMSPGRGRFIHPTQRRSITAHEAARIQGFPDSFDFSIDGHEPPKKLLGKWIGDAVPSQLGYVAVLAALTSL